MSSSKSRKLKLKRKYHRTQVAITVGSNLRFQNKGGRHDLIALPLSSLFRRNTSDKRIRRGVFRDVEELIVAIESYIDHHNQAPKPFIWTAKAADILEKVKRARAKLNNRHSA